MDVYEPHNASEVALPCDDPGYVDVDARCGRFRAGGHVRARDHVHCSNANSRACCYCRGRERVRERSNTNGRACGNCCRDFGQDPSNLLTAQEGRPRDLHRETGDSTCWGVAKAVV